MIKDSVGCQWLGVWSLVPLVGLVFAVATILRYRSICAEVGNEWNPARKQLIRGAIFAWSGILITSLLLLAIPVHLWLEWFINGGN
jgi:hypothetical protein